jgi:biotin synthase
MLSKKLTGITQKILADKNVSITFEDAIGLINENVFDLVMRANKIREKYKGTDVFTCSIINARSGLCSQDCAFCAQSVRHKTGIAIYPLMNEDEMVKKAVEMYSAGATRYSIVTSGYMLNKDEAETICRAAARIKKDTGLMVCGSLGMLTKPLADKLKESGVDNYHHNLETARSYFPEICTTHDYEQDIETVKLAASAGLGTCSGGILGLGETWEQRIELAFTLKDMNVNSIPLNFLNPIRGTRMEKQPVLPPMEAIACIAIFRILHPGKDIIVCGGRELTLRDFQSWVFPAGANGLMIGNYLTTRGRSVKMDIDMIREMGLFRK